MTTGELKTTGTELMENKKRKLATTLYIANRAFGGLRKFSTMYQYRQIVDLAFKN